MSAAVNRKISTTADGAPQATDLVFGLGKTGLSVARYFNRAGVAVRFVDTREKPPGLAALREIAPDAEIVLGAVEGDVLDGITRVVASPGIPNDDALLVAAREAGIEVVSDIQLFVDAVRSPVIGVTGSNGKSTVTTVIGLMCDAAGVTALTGGNLGEPALDLLDRELPDCYVIELSSFQLQRTPRLPLRVAVLLNVSPDHLDWHASEDEYRRAKYRVFDEAGAAVFERADARAAASVTDGAARRSFGRDVPPAGHYGLEVDGDETWLKRGEERLLPVSDIALVGAHNHTNLLAALAACELLGIDIPRILDVAREYPGLPHRMQHVATVAGVDYINDSKATNVGAAVASVQSIAGPVVLLAGGQGKGGDFPALAGATASKLRCAVLFGEDAGALEAAFDGLAPSRRVADLPAAVQIAAAEARAGDTVVLAPACASFDQYPRFEARGDHFQSLVQELRP